MAVRSTEQRAHHPFRSLSTQWSSSVRRSDVAHAQITFTTDREGIMTQFRKIIASEVCSRIFVMNRVCSLLALAAALGCSSENSGSKRPLDESASGTPTVRQSSAGSANSPESNGGGLNFSGATSAPNGSGSAGGGLGFSGGGAAGLGAAWPGKLAPTRESALAVLDRITTLYQDYAAAAEPQGTHRLIGTINEGDLVPHAHANIGALWEIYITPNLLTHPTISLDMVALLSCHEIGHFVGGFPFKGDGVEAYGTMSAAEAQADYFATKDCLPRLWADELGSNAAAFAELDSSERELCTKAYGDQRSQELCARLLFTAVQIAPFYHQTYLAQGLAGAAHVDPSLTTPDPNIVSKTVTGTVDGQCRLDTMVAGIQCQAKGSGTTIPGYLPPYGEYSTASAEAARQFNCQDGAGARPKCWFNPDDQGFDCTGFEHPRCVVDDGGQVGFYECHTARGPTFSSCTPYECLTDADGIPSCGPPIEQ